MSAVECSNGQYFCDDPASCGDNCSGCTDKTGSSAVDSNGVYTCEPPGNIFCFKGVNSCTFHRHVKFMKLKLNVATSIWIDASVIIIHVLEK